MKEIVVISGKGGTGKTSITASLAYLSGKKAIIADCDVDAADMHLIMQPDFANDKDFYSGLEAKIDQEKCIRCGNCARVCHFEAIPIINNKYVVDDIKCEGCGYCFQVCPADAITMEDKFVGKTYISVIKTGARMVHAKLNIGAENSGKLVAEVKNMAKELAEELGKEFVIVDGSPGIGCPVVSSLSGADYVVLVTEPSVSGFHDLKRVNQLIKNFKIKTGYIVNKADLNTELTDTIKKYLRDQKIDLLGELPYDEVFNRAITEGISVVETENNRIKDELKQVWNKLFTDNV